VTPRSNVFIMSVDVDSWSSLLRFYSINHDSSMADFQVGFGITKLLELFRKHDIKATFFVPGEVAVKNEQIVRVVSQEGHEVGCHGSAHEKNECLLTMSQQMAKIKEATEIIQKQTGRRPKGFRAPCLRANGETVRVLERLGYVYDSSVLPSIVPGYYGYPTFLSKPYHPSFTSLAEKGESKILEFPVSVNPILRVPFSAAWMRNLGLRWVKLGIRMNFDRANPVVFYVHPRDVTPLPRIKGLPWHVYKNTGYRTIEMLDKIIEYVKKQGEILQGIELAERLGQG